MVAKDDNGKPTKVPGLILETRDQVRRFLEAIKRKELKGIYKIELDNARTALSVDAEQYKLSKERCKLAVNLEK